MDTALAVLAFLIACVCFFFGWGLLIHTGESRRPLTCLAISAISFACGFATTKWLFDLTH
jgi:hypothetical protein